MTQLRIRFPAPEATCHGPKDDETTPANSEVRYNPALKLADARENNKIKREDRPFHDWYRFILSFPPHLVREYIKRFGIGSQSRVLDPFCGTGTTLVECKKLGVQAIGIEANPMACFASRIKTDWDINPDSLFSHAAKVAEIASEKVRTDGVADETMPLFHTGHKVTPDLRTLPKEAWNLLLKGSISPLPLHRTLVLLDTLAECQDERLSGHERLALAKALVFGIGNLEFGPEVGVGTPRADAPVLAVWLNAIRAMTQDLRELRDGATARAIVMQGDSRQLGQLLEPHSIDAVITSPPYPNEKDYTRTTRLESILLGFIRSRADLRALKCDLVRSNTRSVYKDDRDDLLVSDHKEICEISDRIEKRRIELGKTSGFERQYARLTKLYFGGITRHLADLQVALRPGAQLAYVVGDQASYLQVMIRTGHLLADIAGSLGYQVLGIDLFRTRRATATREELREEVVLLRWPGSK